MIIATCHLLSTICSVYIMNFHRWIERKNKCQNITLSIETVTSVITAMIQLANHNVLFVKIKVFWLIGNIWSFLLQKIEYQRLFHRQQNLEILFCFSFMRAYEFCSISNIDQSTKIFAMDFSYLVEEIINTKIFRIYRKICTVTAKI